MKQTQLNLFESQKPSVAFIPMQGRRKIKRPLSTKNPIHLILKSAKHDLRRNERDLRQQWNRFALKFGIKTYALAINSDHAHAIVRLHSQRLYNRFVQALTGTLARKFQIKWLCRPFTRIAQWGRDYRRMLNYLKLNWLEGTGRLDYQPARTRKLPGWLRL